MKTIVLANPFVVGRYVSDSYFCDRESETALLIKQVVNGRNVALISPRRMGKTGLVRHLFNQETIKQGYYAFFVDIYATQITSSAFIKKYNLPSASSVQSSIKPLLKSDIITQEDDTYRVYDYFLESWLREVY